METYAAMYRLAELRQKTVAEWERMDVMALPTTGTVVGAHLSGQPLNWQLTERRARLVRTCRTAPNYRLYALSDTTRPSPA